MEFWFSKFYPNINQFELGNYRGIVNMLIESINSFVSHKFEDICMEIIIYLNNQMPGYFPFDIQKIGRWWGSSASKTAGKNKEEIDIVGLSENTKNIIFAECKWTDKPVDVPVYNDLKRKAKYVMWNNDSRNEYYLLFSKSGFTDKIRNSAKSDHVLLFDLNKIEELIK